MSIEGCFDREVEALNKDLENGMLTPGEHAEAVRALESERAELEAEEDRRNEGPGWGNR